MRDAIKKINGNGKKKLLVMLTIAMIALPALTFSGHEEKLYVDAKASGKQTGSQSHPFKTIDQAMDKADEDTEIHVAKGTYEENVTIKKGVELYGEDENDVTIKADSDEKAAVTMKHKTKINKITVRGGEEGIKVENNAKASIIKCIIKYNDEDGIDISSGDVTDSKAVTISDSEIRDNGRAGIYSKKRRLVLTDNEIENNRTNGIDIEAGTSAWISGNHIKNNKLSGMKMRIDGSNIWTKHNSIRNNMRGLEIGFSGAAGRISVEYTKLVDNTQFGMLKTQPVRFASDIALWNKYLGATNQVEYWGNPSGNISGITLAK